MEITLAHCCRLAIMACLTYSCKDMKQIKEILLVALVGMALSACTHNDGNIGVYFGTWKVEEITIDGVADIDYRDNLFFQFQSGVFCMRRVDEHHIAAVSWGTWEEVSDNVLRLSFVYSDDNNPEGSEKYSPLPESHLPKGVSDLDILQLTGSAMKLQYLAEDEIEYVYNLKKW